MRQSIVITVLVAIIAFTAGCFVGTSLSVSQKSSSSNFLSEKNFSTENDTYVAGWNAAKKRIAESGLWPISANAEIKNVSGEVKSIKDNQITIKIHALEPLADPDLDERIIEVDNNTKIYSLTSKDQKEYQAAIEEFNKKMQERAKTPAAPGVVATTPAATVIPPEPYNKKLVPIADIKTGMQLNVVAAEKDIKSIKKFKASEIILPIQAAIPTSVVPPTSGTDTSAVPAADIGTSLPAVAIPTQTK